jgi:hypothetical protein
MSTDGLTEIGWPGAAFTTRTRPELAIAAAAPSGRVLGEEKDGAEQDVTYKVLYPKLHGMAATTRILLALGGVRWESIYPSVSNLLTTLLLLLRIMYKTREC